MFEELYFYAGVIRRHREAPLANERAAYLKQSAARGVSQRTLLRQARYVRCVAVELPVLLPGQSFTPAEVRILARNWASRRSGGNQDPNPRGAMENFRCVATDFLRSLGRLEPDQPAEDLGEFEAKLDEFVSTQQERHWRSEATRQAGRWQIRRFLAYLKQRRLDFYEISADDVDAYYKHASLRWKRSSLRRSASALRKWFEYGEQRGWSRPGLAATVQVPRVYRDEGLPMGPAWETVGRMLDGTIGDSPGVARDRAIILLLSVYGVRSGEVRRLRLDDIDWACDRIQIMRSKSGRLQQVPLQAAVGEAIAEYVWRHRPRSSERTLFLTLRAPYRPLSQGGLYDVVARHYPVGEAPCQGRGPHGLRHACARHLVESGHSFKETGDHLGHRSPDSTRTYAKVALTSLRLVALEDLGDLA